MGMISVVKGFVPPDEEWHRMKRIWDSCKEAGIEPPKEVTDFFDDEPPDDAGKEVEIKYTEWRGEMEEGIEINVEDLLKKVKKVKIIRFYTVW